MIGGITTVIKPRSIAAWRNPIDIFLPWPLSLGQIDAECSLHRLVRTEAMVIDTHMPGLLPELPTKRLETLQIVPSNLIRIDEHLVPQRFEISELRQSVKRKVDLLASQDMEQDHFMASMAEMPQRF